MYPDFPLAEYIARYWPYLLIVWGAVRIVEICYWAGTSKPLPTRGISGGEWVLVLFVCLVGMGIHVVQGTIRWWPERIPWAGIQVIGEQYRLSGKRREKLFENAAHRDRGFSGRRANYRLGLGHGESDRTQVDSRHG